MTTTTSADSASVEHGGSVFTEARLVHSFPHHEIVKLDERTFVQWKQHVRLIVERYELTGFLDGMVSATPRFVPTFEGSLVPNPDASAFI